MNHTHTPLGLFGTTLLVALVLAAAGYGGYRYYELNQAYASSQANASALAAQLAETSGTAESLQNALSAARAMNLELGNQLGQVSNTAATLTKLTQTDPELLQKYSKVYFLSDTYVPASLTQIDSKYLYYGSAKPLQFQTQAYSFLSHMIDDARKDGVDLSIISAYRSFGTQAALKSEYEVTYGSGANAFSADQGYSEHQLGTAIDFTTSKLGASFDSFASVPAYAWLTANAYKYGFILSYPKGNTYYEFEPWHWRFVGTALAGDLKSEGKNFYDLDQRTIDTYLLNIFD